MKRTTTLEQKTKFAEIKKMIETASNFATVSIGDEPALGRYNPKITLREMSRDATYGYTITKSATPCATGVLYDAITFSYGRINDAEESDMPFRDWCDKLELHILLKDIGEVSFIHPSTDGQAINVNDVVLRDLQLSTFLNTHPLMPVEPITR